MYFNITDASYINDYKIMLTFNNGKSGIVDLWEYIQDGEIFQPIKSSDEFKKFFLEFGTITWKNGEIDIAPETLYEKATGESVILGLEQVQKAG